MNLRDAEYFVAIVEERSFSKAAVKLFVAQSSLSMFLSRLERAMGVELILRNNNTITLTHSGEIYYSAAKEILETQKNMLAEIDAIKTAKRETIRVGVAGELSLGLVSRVLAEFYQKNPNVRVTMRENISEILNQLLQTDEIDFGIFPVVGRTPELKCVPLWHEELVIVMPKTHRLAHRGKPFGTELERLDINEFQEDSFVLLTKGKFTRQLADTYFEKVGFYPKIFTEVQNSHSTKVVLSSGIDAVGFSPLSYDYSGDNLLYVALELPLCYDIALYYRKGAVLSPAREHFVKLIQKYGSTY